MAKLQPWIIVNQGLALYRRNFAQFFRLSLSAAMWSIIAIAIPLFLTIMIFTYGGNLNSSLISFLSFLALALSTYISAEALVREKVIEYIAYQHIIGSPQPLRTIFRESRKQLWQFWLARSVIYIKLCIVLIILLIFVPEIKFGKLIWLGSFPATYYLTIICLEYYLYGILICVNKYNSLLALKMSKQKLKPHIFEVFLIWFLTEALNIPIILLCFLPANQAWNELDWTFDMVMINKLIYIVQLCGLGLIIQALISIIKSPLSGSITALIYANINDNSYDVE